MVKRIAANWILFQSSKHHDAMIELRDGVVTDIIPLASLQAEPQGTIFLNGTLSGENGAPLFIGYNGALYLNNKIITQ